MSDILRWPTRQLHQSIANHLKAGMTALGWFEIPNPNGLTTGLLWDPDYDVEEHVLGDAAPVPNLIGISMEMTPDSRPQEMGGGIVSVSYPVTIDIYGENRSQALNMGDDIMAILRGEQWAPSRYIPLYDHSQTPPELLTDRVCEATLIEGRWPAGTQVEWRRRWRIVNFTAQEFYTGPE
jgi:hypothetical protein